MSTTTKTQRPRINKGTLVATTNTARLSCMNFFDTVYLYRPVGYQIVSKRVIDKSNTI